MKKNWQQPKQHPAYAGKAYAVFKNPLTPEVVLDARHNDFVFGGGTRSVTFPQLGNATIVGRTQASHIMPVLACGWPAIHHGRLIFFSNN